MESQVTFELTVRFGADAAATAAATKRLLLAWLAEQGVRDIAEGVVDGVVDEVAQEGAPAFEHGVTVDVEGTQVSNDVNDPFGAHDRSPVLIYDVDRERLEMLGREIARCFDVETCLGALSNEAWSAAWNEQAELIETGRFVVKVGGVSVGGRERDGNSGQHGKIVLTVRPGEAFGSGRHATTEVMLRMLERHAERDGGSVLDVGTGTGILLVAASRLGYDELVGTDIDAAVLAEARANAEDQGVPVDLRLSGELPGHGRRFDLVLANILVPVLHALMPQLAAALRPDGVLMLAGFIEKEAGPLIDAAAGVGLVVRHRTDVRGWIGLEMRLIPSS